MAKHVKYLVRLSSVVNTYASIVVEAESEEQAKDLALGLAESSDDSLVWECGGPNPDGVASVIDVEEKLYG